MTPSKGQPSSRAWQPSVLAVLSLVPTPLLIFIAPSTRLYVRNRAQLNDQLEVLLPFLEMFVLAAAVGGVLFLFSKYAPFRYALVGYYLAGPFFLLYRFLHGATETLPFLSWMTHTESGGLTALSLFTLAVLVVGWKLRRSSVILPLAVFGILLIVGEAWTLRPAFRNRPVEAAVPSEDAVMAAADESLPNVYHVLLDGFQTDMLTPYLSPEVEDALGGFTFFPNNEAVYHLTATSLASMFASKRYAYERAKWEYMEQSINGVSSLLARLNRLGYVTTAHVPALQDTRIEIADYVVRQEDHARERLVAMNTSAFAKLWIFSQIPSGVRAWLASGGFELGLDQADLQRMEEGRFLSYSGPVVSAVSFSQWIQDEKNRPSGGRYSFVHLLMPHPPYVLRSDCSYEQTAVKTDMPEQVQCTLQLVLGFLEQLHELDRFDESLIVINGDHGDNFRMKNNVLVESRSRSLRALLLVKPVGKGRQDGFHVSDAKTSILDIYPTILDCLGVEGDDALEGRALTGTAKCREVNGEPGR
ncbi:MAG: sulfatase-like hydrolase/transferase [Vicinamibacteria bacterium]